MRRLLLVTCLVTVLLQEAGAIPVPQVLVKTNGKHKVAEQDTEKAWDTRAVEPLEKDDQLGKLLPVPKWKPAAEKLPDAAGTRGRSRPHLSPHGGLQGTLTTSHLCPKAQAMGTDDPHQQEK
ncbi:proline-rich acidic protein 1 isoform X2 [Castor canadensis]|uniref:Proline-rich acidic protein 1 isoform X2 n=1 Tax=Castor canadensis TaxID=51338 RepID=A0AC58MXH6_CASCN